MKKYAYNPMSINVKLASFCLDDLFGKQFSIT